MSPQLRYRIDEYEVILVLFYCAQLYKHAFFACCPQLPLQLFLLYYQSVGRLCKDCANTPITLNKLNGSELPNSEVKAFFRHITGSEQLQGCITWHMSVSKTLKVRKINPIHETPISPSSPFFNFLQMT